jgi:V-type H+-transporting ATPase subunit a
MFGDVGHGSIIAAFGLFLTLGHEKLQKGFFDAFLGMRYFILLMGIMSTYCGLIYNEFFAVPLEIFSSCYKLEERYIINGTDKVYGYARRDKECTYPFGTDPVWGNTSNKLNFVNSIKMKISVIMGVIHMTMGIICKGTNAVFHR